MDLTEQINKTLFDNSTLKPLKAQGVKESNKLDQRPQQRPKNRINPTLNGISEENAHAINRAKEIMGKESERRNSVKDLRIKLSKQIKGLENPYNTLETALTIIELLLNEPVYLKPFKAQIEAIRAKELNDPLAKLYAEGNLQELIEKLESSYSKNSENSELRKTIRNLKERKSEIEANNKVDKMV